MHRNAMTRHEFLKIMSLATAAGLGLYTGLVEPHWLELVRRPLSIRNLPPNELRIDAAGGSCANGKGQGAAASVRVGLSRIWKMKPDRTG